MTMNRKKTKKEKIRTQSRQEQNYHGTFSVDPTILKRADKSDNKQKEAASIDFSYMKLDLTKTAVLTMLVLALEIVIWKLITRQ